MRKLIEIGFRFIINIVIVIEIICEIMKIVNNVSRGARNWVFYLVKMDYLNLLCKWSSEWNRQLGNCTCLFVLFLVFVYWETENKCNFKRLALVYMDYQRNLSELLCLIVEEGHMFYYFSFCENNFYFWYGMSKHGLRRSRDDFVFAFNFQSKEFNMSLCKTSYGPS